MAKGIAEINTSDSDELRLKKINTNFKNLVTGEVPVGAISGTGGGYNSMLSRVGTTLSSNDRFVRTLSAYAIDAQYISAETINTDALVAEYAQVNFANIGDLAAKNIWTKTLASQEVMAKDGYFTQVLNAVKIQTDAFVANTITADKLRLSNGDQVSIDKFVDTSLGLFKVINETVLKAQGIDLSDRISQIMTQEGLSEEQAIKVFNNGIDGSSLVVGSVDADRITCTDLFAFQATLGGFHINDPEDPTGKGGLYANLDDGGKFEMRPDGYFRAGNVSTYIEVSPGDSQHDAQIDIHCTTMHTEEDMTIASNWKWDFVPSTGALNLLYIGV